MNDSGIERTHEIAKDKALGYDLKENEFVNADNNYMGYAIGGGDFYSTTLDILKWDSALYTDTLINCESKQLLFNGNPNEFGTYGYGFKIKEYTRSLGKSNTGKLVRHGGSMYGYFVIFTDI